ncbi:unnamed protein product [Bursaphelenchus xylophilus]|uniref:(pine wood nematode) hypothetical protein n=1 Tax=Bursaphelenchus xylophilus TaxID=6326 RepID=A0A1I7S6N7_BURXY|nr:unnamed protein product [Bursaphelenchus xylophilus]CAG9120614.1 unnamed protein product [Bursaphelenchus xylophilus]
MGDAEAVNDVQKLREIQDEIDALDQKANDRERNRQGKLAAVTLINHKRREEMRRNFLDPSKIQFDTNREDDPFTRKSNKAKVVAGGSKKPKEEAAPKEAEAPAPAPAPLVKPIERKPEFKFNPLLMKPQRTSHLAKHLDVEIDIDI